jgi:methyl-accepting chemotaxis protein
MSFLKNLSLKAKIMITGMVVAFMPVFLVCLLITFQKGRVVSLLGTIFSNQAENSLTLIAHDMYALCESQQESIRQMLGSHLNVAKDIIKRNGGVRLAKDTVAWDAVSQLDNQTTSVTLPKMTVGGQWLGRNLSDAVATPVVDETTKLVGDTCTIFQRMNERGDMLRVATTVVKKDGTRAIGTYIAATDATGHANPVIASALAGKTYYGRAYVVDGWYITVYDPLKDAAGNVIGMLYVGVKQENVESLRRAILSTHIGQSGYVCVLGGSGSLAGTYVISRDGARDGENLLSALDKDGHPFIRDILTRATSAENKGQVTINQYTWMNKGDDKPREQIAAVIYYEPWDWVIFATSYKDELLGEVVGRADAAMSTLLWSAIGFGIIVLGFGGVAYYFLTQYAVINPLNRLMAVAQKINAGDVLHQEIKLSGNDEIGRLAGVFNTLFKHLDVLVNRATLISQGVIGADEVEDRINLGMALEQAAKIDKEKSDLADSFDQMQAELRKLTIQARKIAIDDLNNPVLDVKIAGELGEAFNLMTSNLKEMASLAQRIAAHDLTVTTHLEANGGVLGGAFATMAANLKSLIATINILATENYRSASFMAESTEQSHHTVADMQNSIQQIASAISQISKSAQDISRMMERATASIGIGKENISKVIGKFESVQDKIGMTGTSIEKLEQRSQEISEIVGLITKIADQTNLLALNAAIEAARAGEAGKGFAVVADEVRKLAESSGQSAEDISRIIKEIQTDTAGVVKSSQVTLEEAHGVLDLAGLMQDGYKEIVKAIDGMGEQVENIAALSEETASSAEEISSGAEEQTATIDGIADGAATLLDNAGKLKREIEKFKV